MTVRAVAPPTRTPLRLTRRGRLVLVLSVLLLAVIGGITLGHGSSLAAGTHRPAQHTVVVRAGETLWSVAGRVAPQQDPRLIIDQIESLNHLSGAGVEPGQQLVVPLGG